MVEKVKLLFSTLRYLKLSQLFYQIVNRLKRKKYVADGQNVVKEIRPVKFLGDSHVAPKYLGWNSFNFLNIEKHFDKYINWDYSEYGKLWSYNLEYFDYIHQNDITVDEKLRLIDDFYNFSVKCKRHLEPYPVSLRAINLIRFTVSNDLNKQQFHDYLYQELKYLNKNYEYHILGNHLLENAFALALGGAFFKEIKWHEKAIKLLRIQLKEQILSDGAHFELSPMYHNIIFFRLLELVDWYDSYEGKSDEFLSFCMNIASKMCSWLEKMKFNNGDFPLFNDAAKEVAYCSNFLVEYATLLNIHLADIPLGQSGYRSYSNTNYEIKIDFAQIGASYQPGHAHADALSFILYYKGAALFVEQGTSTYQIGGRRNLERSTEAHNTVVVNGMNQSEVWGGFRVGKRANTTIHKESEGYYEASHDGYKKFGVIHKRKFVCGDNRIEIIDELSKRADGKFYLHIHPNQTLSKMDEQRFLIDNHIIVSINGATAIDVEDYDYAETFNLYHAAKRLVVSFTDQLISTISFES